MNQAARAKQAEAKSYIGSINRSQQAYRIENPSFADSIVVLELGIPSSTTDYNYRIAQADEAETIANAAAVDGSTLRSYSGGVVVWSSGQSAAAACESEGVTDRPPGVNLNPAATESDLAATCPEGSRRMR